MGATSRRMLVLAGSGLVGNAAAAQSLTVPPQATKVEQGIGDVGALGGMSRVDLRKDLRQQRGFGDVFRLDVQQPFAQPGQTSSVFFRIDGGVAAVFPESIYRQTPGGAVTEIPPGTTFYVGGLPSPVVKPIHRSPYAADLSVSMRGDRRPDAATVIPAAPLTNGSAGIWEDEQQRQRTVSSLLDRAAMGR